MDDGGPGSRGRSRSAAFAISRTAATGGGTRTRATHVRTCACTDARSHVPPPACAPEAKIPFFAWQPQVGLRSRAAKAIIAAAQQLLKPWRGAVSLGRKIAPKRLAQNVASETAGRPFVPHGLGMHARAGVHVCVHAQAEEEPAGPSEDSAAKRLPRIDARTDAYGRLVPTHDKLRTPEHGKPVATAAAGGGDEDSDDEPPAMADDDDETAILAVRSYSRVPTPSVPTRVLHPSLPLSPFFPRKKKKAAGWLLGNETKNLDVRCGGRRRRRSLGS